MNADFRNVLIAIDGTPDSERVIQAATEYLDRSTCHFKIAVVVQAIPHELATLPNLASPNLPLGEMQAVFESGMTEMANEYATKFDIQVANVNVLFGRPAEEIRACCESNNIDLVVMGLHRSQSNDIGSTTLGLLQRSNCDVLTIRLGNEE